MKHCRLIYKPFLVSLPHWLDLDGKAESGLLPLGCERGDNDLSSAGHVLAQF